MDPLETVALARHLVDIDSTTGTEGGVCAWLAAWLRNRGYTVTEQPVPHSARSGQPGDRVNLLATIDPHPIVILSTHLDCVPPYFPSREEEGFLIGRGACDAKGILAAQVAACERLRASGEQRVGLLFVVGEERGSDGAKAAGDLAGRARRRPSPEPGDYGRAAATSLVMRRPVRGPACVSRPRAVRRRTPFATRRMSLNRCWARRHHAAPARETKTALIARATATCHPDEGPS